MLRIAGVDLNQNKRTDIALTALFGVGRSNVVGILKTAEVDGAKRVKELSEDEVGRIQKSIDSLKVEGDLRADIHANIMTLRQIGSYRGSRHAHNLPSRGQRTRSNARTRRGKRVTIGAIKKKMAEKMGLLQKEAPAKTEEKK